MPRAKAASRAQGPPSGGAPGVVSDARGAATLLDPTRTRLLSELREPGSGASLARRLGLPRQRLNYHLRQLEKQGLVELVEERRRGNCMERVVRATARSYLIDPALLGALGPEPEAVRDRASAGFQIAVAARTIRELAEIEALARANGQRVATLTLDTELRFASAAARNAFAEELTAAVGRLVARYHDTKAAGGRRFRLIAAVHPKRRREGGDA